MIDKDLLLFEEKLRSLHKYIVNILDDYKRVGFENNKLYRVVEGHREELENTLDKFKRYKKDTLEGVLYLQDDGRFAIEGTNIYFTCGDYIEVYNEYAENDIDLWLPGTIEGKFKYNKDGYYVNYYYFNSFDDVEKNIDLYEGMRVRVRVRDR